MGNLSYCQIPLALNELGIKSAYEMQILGLILTLPTGLRLSNRRLAEMLHTSRQTVILSIRRLRNRGYIYNSGTTHQRILNASSELFLLVISQKDGVEIPMTAFEQKIAQSLKKRNSSAAAGDAEMDTEADSDTAIGAVADMCAVTDTDSDMDMCADADRLVEADDKAGSETETDTEQLPATSSHSLLPVASSASHSSLPVTDTGSHSSLPVTSSASHSSLPSDSSGSHSSLPLTGQIFADESCQWFQKVNLRTLNGKPAHTHNKYNKIIRDYYNNNNHQQLETDLKKLTDDFGKPLGKYDPDNARRYLRQYGLDWCRKAIRDNSDCVFLTDCFKKEVMDHAK